MMPEVTEDMTMAIQLFLMGAWAGCISRGSRSKMMWFINIALIAHSLYMLHESGWW